ncbi:MAG TPA: redoxin domain-containing protein [Polyangiaceae bacterium]|nr:redoxin domain-containing protein [Polyangiaceae bacterium]
MTTTVICGPNVTSLPRAIAEGDRLWLDQLDFERATGWSWKPYGLCRGDTCIPIPRGSERPSALGDLIDVAELWRSLAWPIVRNGSSHFWVLGEGARIRADSLVSLEAPEFALPSIDGQLHRLSEFRGRKVFLVTWASWCGCRADLPLWQSLYESTRERGLTVVALALDEPERARPWIDAASAAFPCLIDRDHLTAQLYNFVNVPQAVWIDEQGCLVRPPETAGMTDSFRRMDRKDFTLPAAAQAERQAAKARYYDAVRDWATRGASSPYALDREALRRRLALPSSASAEAHAHFRLGQALLREGLDTEAATEFAEATRLHPESWAIWRQTAEKDASGLAVSDAFWRRVDALGDRPYYAPVDLGNPPEPMS